VSTDNAIHASIHKSDKDIGVEKKEEKKDNAIHASIHQKDGKIGIGWIKSILKGKK
jgi:hypothetical protein